MRPSERLEVRRNIAHVNGKKAGASLSIDLETQGNGVSKRKDGVKRNEDMTRVWRRQVFEATRWSKVRGNAGVVFRELSDVGVMRRQWGTFLWLMEALSVVWKRQPGCGQQAHVKAHEKVVLEELGEGAQCGRDE